MQEQNTTASPASRASVCYLVVIALETDDGWCAAIAEYESAEVFDAANCRGEIDPGTENRIVASCGHRHRYADTCQRCFPKMEKRKRSILKLMERAATIDEKIESLESALKVTNETMRMEFTI
jgi:hypothetical protein